MVIIIGLTGRIAAGKETIKDFLLEQGFEYFVLSHILRQDMEEQGMEISRKTLQDYGNKLRSEGGSGVLVAKFFERRDPHKKYIVDGIRNPGEVEELKKHGAILIAVDAPQKIRFERMLKRAKPSDPTTWEGFLEIDNRDFGENDSLGQQVGKCMAMADYTIVNDGTISESLEKIKNVWSKIQTDSGGD